jgi:phage repressor protein C with HTH and peptisase S24 domain
METGTLQRIKEYIDFKELTVSFFEKEVGMSNGSFASQLKNNKTIGVDKLENILKRFKDLNPEWVLTGNGEMQKISNLNVLKESPSVYNLKTDNEIKSVQNIPLYNIEATAGIVTLFSDSSKTTPIDFIQIPGLPKCDGALYITGDSMYPLLKSGDIVMYKQIVNIKDGIFWGEMYLISISIDGDELVTVKYIQRSEKGDNYIKLVSQNSHHQDRDIKLDKVRALALIKASIRINSMS